MKKLITLYAILFSFFVTDLAIAQTITKSVSGPVSDATCPGIGIQYEVSLPTGFGACQINWTVTNGIKQSQSGNTAISNGMIPLGQKAK